MRKKANRIGETNINCQGLKMTIISYRGAHDIDVQFEDGYVSHNKDYRYFKNGTMKSYFVPTVLGVGIIGGEDIDDKSYLIWFHMLRRCYDKKLHSKEPTYKDVTCCEEWLNYQNFKKWFDNNYYEIDNDNMQLDKDILYKDNKIYSPETCVFVNQRINKLFIKRKAKRGSLPIGVTYNKRDNKIQARCDINNGNNSKKFLGTFDTPEEAFKSYKTFKEKYIKQVAEEYKDKIPKKLYDAMYRYEVEITD